MKDEFIAELIDLGAHQHVFYTVEEYKEERKAIMACRELMRWEDYVDMVKNCAITIPVENSKVFFHIEIKYVITLPFAHYPTVTPRLFCINDIGKKNWATFCVNFRPISLYPMPEFDKVLGYYLLFTTELGRMYFLNRANFRFIMAETTREWIVCSDPILTDAMSSIRKTGKVAS